MKKFKIVLLPVIACILAISFGNSINAAPTDTYKLNVEGTAHYSKIKDMLTLMNEERSKLGASALILDDDLTKIAMRRAAECVVDFSHTRPDGTSCFDLSSKIGGENVLAGLDDAKNAFDLWCSSQGHYSNIIATRFKSVGIGCFSQNNTTYWVQIFSDYNSNNTCTTTGSKSATYSIKILEGDFPLQFILNSVDVNLNKPLQLKVGRINPGWSALHCYFLADSFNWSSSSKDVATVDETGLVKGIGYGEATITASPKGNSNVSIPLKVKSFIKNADGSDITIEKPAKVTSVTCKKIKKRAIKIRWKKVTGADGYRIKYSTKKKMVNTLKRNTTKRKYLIKKLKPGKTYYFKVQAYKKIDGLKLFGKWSKKVKIKL